jgi:hypothetical protein
MARAIIAHLGTVLLLPVWAAGCASSDMSRDNRQVEQQSEGRQFYSPHIRSDPYVQAQWDASARALEAECARSGKYCTEAKKARAALAKLPRSAQGR